MVVKHGISWAAVHKLEEDTLNTYLESYGLPITGDLENRRRLLWEAALPVYPIPELPSVTEAVFTELLDDNDEPYPHGVLKYALVEKLKQLGYPDEASAQQAIDTQVDSLVLYYGYRRVESSKDVIIVEKRNIETSDEVDPNVSLRTLRALAEDTVLGSEIRYLMMRENFKALDRAMSRGDDLPDGWKR